MNNAIVIKHHIKSVHCYCSYEDRGLSPSMPLCRRMPKSALGSRGRHTRLYHELALWRLCVWGTHTQFTSRSFPKRNHVMFVPKLIQIFRFKVNKKTSCIKSGQSGRASGSDAKRMKEEESQQVTAKGHRVRLVLTGRVLWPNLWQAENMVAVHTCARTEARNNSYIYLFSKTGRKSVPSTAVKHLK